MDSKIKLIADSFGRDRVKLNEPLKDHAALQVGGPANLFFIALTESEMVKMINTCRQLKVPLFLFGTGSKIMISDRGFNGVVIKNRTSNIKVVSVKGKVSKYGIGVAEALVEVASGVSINKFVEFLDSQNFNSLEFSGIPGSIGGNLFLNRALQEKVESIKVIDANCKLIKITAKELSLNKHLIISTVFRIKAKN